VIDAETYDSYLVPAIYEPSSRDLIKRAQVWNGDKVLDVACGTGIVACRIASSGATVTGLDLAADRLARAKQRAQDEGVSVKWTEASAESLPFRQPAIDLVTCQHGLQYIGNAALAAREMRRVIKPGGRAAVAVWAGIEHQGPFHVLDEIAGRATGKRYVEPFAFGDAAALDKLLTDARFFAVNVETVTRQIRVPDPARFAATILADIIGEPAPDDAIAEATAALAPFVDGEQLVFPMTSLLAVGRVKT
jgi:ubiquinone/menaquinone biosynthesis C-methylase UbiE